MTMRRLGGLLLIATLMAPSAARASCEAPAPALVWSYPSDGATGIPTDAEFLFLADMRGVERVLLDGRELEERHVVESASVRAFVPGELEPDTTYRLTVMIQDFVVEEVPVELSFTTGSGRSMAQSPAVELLDIRPRDEPLGGACIRVRAAQDCYDTGQDTDVLLDVDAQALAYVVSTASEPGAAGHGSVLWPASCGDPNYYGHADSSVCYVVHALDETGRVASSRQLCGAADESDSPASSASADAGCAAMAARGRLRGDFALAFLAGTLLWRTRRSRVGLTSR